MDARLADSLAPYRLIEDVSERKLRKRFRKDAVKGNNEENMKTYPVSSLYREKRLLK